MKPLNFLLSIVFILVLNIQAYGQNYQSLFGSDSTSWDITFGYCDGQTTTGSKVLGDTIINSMSYKKVGGFLSFLNLSGYLREDTVSGKAWYYRESNSTEYLTMDLSLNINDTFDIYDFSNTPHHFCVDSIYYMNGRKHVQLNATLSLCGSHGRLTFVEGVGTTAGLFFQGSIDFLNYYMLCQHKNGVKVASNLIYPNSCFVQSIGINENQLNGHSIKVFPVPASTSLTVDINLPTSDLYQISVFDLNGELILQTSIENSANTIDVSGLKNGIYQILIENEDQVRHSRFIKN